MKKALPFTASCLVIALASACNAPTSETADRATTPPTKSATAPSATTGAAVDDAAMQGFLASIYGASARLKGEWKAVPIDAAYRDDDVGSEEDVTREVCEDETVTLAGVPTRLVAVCGTVADAGHPTPGINDFFMLQSEGGQVLAKSRAHMEAYGSMGFPGEVDAVQLGPDTWGFEVESGFTNMGYSTQSTSFVVPRGSGFRDTGLMRSGISNLGSIPDCDDDKPCTSPKAFDIDFDITPDRTAAGAVWPLIVTESGPACGSQASAVHRVEFDDAAGVYRVPRILKRETCEDDWGED